MRRTRRGTVRGILSVILHKSLHLTRKGRRQRKHLRPLHLTSQSTQTASQRNTLSPWWLGPGYAGIARFHSPHHNLMGCPLPFSTVHCQVEDQGGLVPTVARGTELTGVSGGPVQQYVGVVRSPPRLYTTAPVKKGIIQQVSPES